MLQKLEYKQVLSEREYRENVAIYGPGSFTVKTGAEAALTLLEEVDLEAEFTKIQAALEGAQEKRKADRSAWTQTFKSFLTINRNG